MSWTETVGYFGYLATHMPTQRLMSTAARKALRRARRRLVPGGFFPSDAELAPLLSFRADGAPPPLSALSPSHARMLPGARATQSDRKSVV